MRKKSTESVAASSASWEALSERFESRLLPAFKRRTEEVGRLLPEPGPARSGPGRLRPSLARGTDDLREARNLSGLPTVRATKTTEALGAGG